MSEQPSLPYPEPGGQEFTQGHSGTDTSRERAIREATDGTAKHRQSTALRLAQVFRITGITVKDLREMSNIHHGQASSALSVLHKEGRLARLAETRDRCKVYVLPEYVGERTTEPFGRGVPEGQVSAEAVRELMAQAWDEGWQAYHEQRSNPDPNGVSNPYKGLFQ